MLAMTELTEKVERACLVRKAIAPVSGRFRDRQTASRGGHADARSDLCRHNACHDRRKRTAPNRNSLEPHTIVTRDLQSIAAYRLDASAALKPTSARRYRTTVRLRPAEALARAYQGLLKARQYGLKNCRPSSSEVKRWSTGSPTR